LQRGATSELLSSVVQLHLSTKQHSLFFFRSRQRQVSRSTQQQAMIGTQSPLADLAAQRFFGLGCWSHTPTCGFNLAAQSFFGFDGWSHTPTCGFNVWYIQSIYVRVVVRIRPCTTNDHWCSEDMITNIDGVMLLAITMVWQGIKKVCATKKKKKKKTPTRLTMIARRSSK